MCHIYIYIYIYIPIFGGLTLPCRADGMARHEMWGEPIRGTREIYTYTRRVTPR